MTYAEIIAEVTTLTNSPHLSAEIASMVKAATLRMHHSDFYARDIAESVVDLGSEGFSFSFDAQATFSRFRALAYLRKYDNDEAVAGALIKRLDLGNNASNLLDSYGVEKNDVWYAAGNNVVLRSSSSLRYMLAGWYQNPITDSATYSSWIADLVPHAIIFDAASLIFQMVDQQEQSRKFDALVLEQVTLVKMHGLNAQGY